MVNSIKLYPLKAVKLSSMVEDEIKALFVNGQLKKGDRLPTEKELGAKFGVSLITIREALRGLEALGVIEKRRGKEGGIFISSNSDSIKNAVLTYLNSRQFTLKDIAEVRNLLQPFCVKLAAERISSELMQAMEKNVKECENKLKRHKNKFTEENYYEIEGKNKEFHRLIGTATCNPILALTVDYVEDFLNGIRKIKGNPNIGEVSIKIAQHRKIVQGLKTGDPVASEDAMSSHLEYFLNR